MGPFLAATWTGLLKKNPPQQVHIPLSQLDAIEYKNPFYLFHATLLIRVRSLHLLSPVPGSNGVEVTLYCKKRYRRIAQDIGRGIGKPELSR